MARIKADDPTAAQTVARRFRTSVETVCLFPSTGRPTDVDGIFVFGGTPKQPFRFTFKVEEDRIRVLRVFRASREHIQY